MHISQVWLGALWSVPHLFDLYWFPHDMESTVFSVRRTLDLRINSQGSRTLPSNSLFNILDKYRQDTKPKVHQHCPIQVWKIPTVDRIFSRQYLHQNR